MDVDPAALAFGMSGLCLGAVTALLAIFECKRHPRLPADDE
jgi:hypothetical protein